MMRATREPFLSEEEPFLSDTPVDEFGVSENSETEAVSSTDDNESLPVPKAPMGDCKLMLRLPKSVHERLVAQAKLERRQVRVVIEYAIETFINEETCEPRLYLPYQYRAEDKVETQIRISNELSDDLNIRAFEEERTRNAVVLRALLNYLESHEGRSDR